MSESWLIILKSIPIKLITGLASLSAIGGGVGYGIYKHNYKTNTIENYLKENKLSIVSKNDDSFWTKVHSTYLLEKEISNLEITDKAITSKEEIKNWCHDKKNFLINSSDNQDYKKVAKWCTPYKTIKETFGSNKKLNDSVSDLNTKYESLEQNLKNIVNQIQITASANLNGEKFKKWCEENSNRTYSNEEEVFAKNIKQNCLKNNP